VRKYWERSKFGIGGIILPLLALMLLSSCGNVKEGCMDANASNFDVSADKDCCCTYPRMGLQFEYYNGDKLLSQAPLIDVDGDTITLSKLTFYVSGLHWKDAEDKEIRSDKRLWLFLSPNNFNDSTRSIDDYYLIEAHNARIQDFTFTRPFSLKSLALTIGVADSALANQPWYMKNANHPLAGKKDNMYDFDAGQYRTLRMAYSIKNSQTDPDTVYVDSGQSRFKTTLTLNYHTVLGFDNYIIIRLYLNRLIEGIRFRTDDPEVISDKLAANLENLLLP